MQSSRTLEEVREWFVVNGLTVAEWSKAHGIAASVVYALLSGRTRGRRGDAHRAAVALGIKPNMRAGQDCSAGKNHSAMTSPFRGEST
jgi:gp16 family phage-associated protein